ncbi:MAG: NAD(P)H-dependent oxidoreductase [Candidatus Sumerlaeaceae bacterium]|nr:NAD(P)H-dependent oxidoreductase [Candidatus Sumerlaeaceae bacterium]
MNILGIAGSLRKDSYNKKLLAHAAGVAKSLGEDIRIHDLIDLPVYNADVEAAGFPPAVAKFREAVEWADAVVIVTPEYNNSISGVLKNAIDWASTSGNKWSGKVAAIMGGTVGAFGTVLAQAHLRQILVILNVIVVPTPFVYVPRIQDAFDAQGNFTNEIAAKAVEGLLKRLFETTGALKGIGK